MAYRGPTGRSGFRTALCALFCMSIILVRPAEIAAQTQLPGYAQAEDAFMRLTLDERIKLQVLLTAAGYWPAVPDADFNTRLFTRSCASRSTTALCRSASSIRSRWIA